METDGAGRMDAGKFLNLVNRCGLELKEVELARLTSRDLVVPWRGPKGESYYTGLHLFVVAEYFRMASPVRHPWAPGPDEEGELDLEKIEALSAQVNRMLDASMSDEEIEPGEAEEFVMGAERCLARLDPFGPLGEVFDLLRPQVVSKMRNTGRLYLELKRAVTELTYRLHGEAVGGGRGRDQKTRPMFGEDSQISTVPSRELRATTVMGDGKPTGRSLVETSEAAQVAIDEVLQAAEQSADTGESKALEIAQKLESTADTASGAGTEGAEPEKVPMLSEGRTTQIIEIDPELVEEEEVGELADEDSEPVVLLDEEIEEPQEEEDEGVGEGFSRASSVTKRTEALNERLEKLSEHDRKRTEDQDKPAPGGKAGGAVPPPSPAERITELNERRELYMKEQNWEKLVELYEGGLGLFTDPEERQQIFLMLAMLYEVKLRDKASAFGAFARAWKESEGPEPGREKAWEGLQRLSKSSGLHGRYLEWLEEQLSTPMEPAQRIRMQKELSLGLFADEQYESAFDSYAEFLLDEPERFVSEETLNQLERLGEHVDAKKVGQCFEKLRQAELEPGMWELIDEFSPEAPA